MRNLHLAENLRRDRVPLLSWIELYDRGLTSLGVACTTSSIESTLRGVRRHKAIRCNSNINTNTNEGF